MSTRSDHCSTSTTTRPAADAQQARRQPSRISCFAERLPHGRGDRHLAFQHPHLAAAAGALAAAGEFDARRKELVGQRLPRAGMEFELHERLRANRAIASRLACGVPRGTSQPAPQM